MSANNVIQAAYVNLKFLPSRNVCQVILELPMEQADALYDLIRAPTPNKSNWVALAPLGGLDQSVEMTPEPEKPKRRWNEMSRAQRAGMLCADGEFQRWLASLNTSYEYDICGVLREYRAAATAGVLRKICNVTSRSEFDTNEEAGKRWDALEAEYRKTLPVDESRLPERTW